MTKYRVLDAADPSDRSAWEALWRAWPGREVQAHPEYALLFARPSDRTVCAVGEDEDGAILLPLLLRPLAAEPWARPGERRWDAITPYGYGGPFVWSRGPRDPSAFWRAHAEWCRDERLVSTFARLSLFPEQVATIPGPVETRAPNIVLALGKGLDAIWQGYHRNVRANVRAAERAGIEVAADAAGERLDAFVAIYEHTMRRRCALDWYFFPRVFFDALVERLAGQFVFFHALHAGQVVSSELMLVSEHHVYAFLGGTLEEAFRLRPHDLLRHRAIEWSVREEKKTFVLGGGYAPDDGILRHKRNFAPRGEVPFKVACLVHDEQACRELADDRARFELESGRTWSPNAAFFPPYRA